MYKSSVAVYVLFLTTTSFVYTRVTGYKANEYDGHMDFACPFNTILSKLQSQHHDSYEDREWYFSCRQAGKIVEKCHWSGYANDFDQPVSYRCNGNEFINGFRSEHNDHYEDRKWAFQCCQIKGYEPKSCFYTGFINQYDKLLSYAMSAPELLVGVTSIHKNSYEDRIFSFEVCSLNQTCGQK